MNLSANEQAKINKYIEYKYVVHKHNIHSFNKFIANASQFVIKQCRGLVETNCILLYLSDITIVPKYLLEYLAWKKVEYQYYSYNINIKNRILSIEYERIIHSWM